MPARHIADLAGTRLNQLRTNPAGTAGPPSSGAHLIGEQYVDSLGARWDCIASGTPGTWRGAGGSSLSVALGNGAGQVAESVAMASIGALVWDVILKKTSNIHYSRVSAITDLSTLLYDQSNIMEIGSGFPTVSVVLSGANAVLTIDTATTGWTAVIRRYTAT